MGNTQAMHTMTESPALQVTAMVKSEGVTRWGLKTYSGVPPPLGTSKAFHQLSKQSQQLDQTFSVSLWGGQDFSLKC